MTQTDSGSFHKALLEAQTVAPLDAALVLEAPPSSHALLDVPVEPPGDIPPGRIPLAAEEFLTLLASRSSRLKLGEGSATLILALLQALGSYREVRLDASGRVWQSRAHPSAGGTHSIEPVVQIRDVPGLEPGWYRQDGPSFGSIARLETTTFDAIERPTDAALRGMRAPAILYAVADVDLIAARYPTGASLLWRDAGAFLTTGHLLATSFGATSTIVGIAARTEQPLGSGGMLHVVGALAIGTADDAR